MSESIVFTNTNGEIKRKKKSTNDKNKQITLTQEEEINKLKQQLEREINGLNNTESDMLLSKSCVFNIKIPNQFSNIDNAKAHEQTAKEILDDTDNRIDIVVAGIGTGGTAFGLKKFLPNVVKVYGVEPAESPLFTEGKSAPHKIQGIGANFIPEISKFSKLDEVCTVSSDNAINEAKDLAKKHGVFCGISAGANVFVAKKIAKENPDKIIVAIIPDGGDRYLSVW
jgi:cysteine synthase A